MNAWVWMWFARRLQTKRFASKNIKKDVQERIQIHTSEIIQGIFLLVFTTQLPF